MQPATKADIPALVSLVEALYQHESIPFQAERTTQLLERLIDHSRFGAALLLREDGKLTGYFILTWCFSLEFDGAFGLLDELYILPEFRGGGRASRAIEHAKALCRQQGVQALRLEITDGNARAEAIYRRQGFRTDPRRLMSCLL